MGNEEYKIFEEEIKMERVSKIIDEQNFHSSYTQWSKKIVEIAQRHSTTRKRRKPWKTNRILGKAKKNIQKEMERKKQQTEELQMLKKEEINYGVY